MSDNLTEQERLDAAEHVEERPRRKLSPAAGFTKFSFDGGKTWHDIVGSDAVAIENNHVVGHTISIKMETDGRKRVLSGVSTESKHLPENALDFDVEEVKGE